MENYGNLSIFAMPISSVPSNELLETPVFALHELVGSLTFHGFSLFPFGIQYTELELGPHFTLVATDQKQIKAEIVLGLFIESLRIDSQTPFEFVTGAGREGGAFEYLAHFLTAEAEVTDGPHVIELDHFDLSVTPVFGDR